VQRKRWQEIEDVYLSALERDNPRAFLAEQCKDDPELEREVLLLLDEEPQTVTLFGRMFSTSGFNAIKPPARELLDPDCHFGPYVVREHLGSGGSSDVYKAFDPRLDRFVALKVFAQTALAAALKPRFVLEARAAAGVNHPNIATIYEVGEVGPSCYLTMECIDGVRLRDKIGDRTCSEHQRLDYLMQVGRALERAHEHGIVHCDLKPENVMIAGDGLVKILDFGLARLMKDVRVEPALRAASVPDAVADAMPAAIEGTVGYMSPEQAAGQALDERSDVFSFGCMLFEAVTNELPFWHESAAVALHRLLREPPPRVASIVGERSGELQLLLDSCLAKDRNARCSSMAEVNARLRTVPEARSPDQPSPLLRPSRWMVATALVAVLVAAVGAWQWRTPVPDTSVAVIPFARSTDLVEQDAILADGLSDGLINALSQLPDVKVIARTSSSRMSPANLDVKRAARTLGARTVVIGRVDHTAGKLAVSVELLNGVDGTVLWSSDYFPDPNNVIDVQGDLAREIARRVRSKLTAADEQRLSKTLSRNSEAYGLLLRGRYQMGLYTPDSTQKALTLFEQAVGLDPGFALARAELANTYRRLGGAGILNPAEAIPRAEREALLAISGDGEMAEAHTILGDIHRDRWQWDAAEREYRRAIELSASYVPAHQGLGLLMSLRGGGDAAVEQVRRARELDPIGVSSAIDAAAVFYNLRQFDRALETLRVAVNLDSTAAAAWTWIGIVNGGNGQFGDAVVALERAMSMGDDTVATRCYYVHALAKIGRQADAMRQLDLVLKGSKFVPPSALAIAYVGIGRQDRAMEALERAYSARDPLLQYVGVEAHLDALQRDLRFRDLMTRIGLPL
jgi:serine/threonine protein kinase/tetratricopeptide (TPR) repeat protein